MGFTLNIDDETIDQLAAAIASKISSNGAGTAEEVESDEFDEAPAEITLSQVQDAIRESIGKHGKDKIKALVKKVAGADKVTDIAKEKYQAVLDAIKKVK